MLSHAQNRSNQREEVSKMLKSIGVPMWLSSSKRFVIGMGILCTVLLSVAVSATGVPQESNYDIGLKAYIYAYPMVLLEVTRSRDNKLPDNTLYSQTSFPDVNFTKIVSLHLDTLYTGINICAQQQFSVFFVKKSLESVKMATSRKRIKYHGQNC
jgi:hypothetical protein